MDISPISFAIGKISIYSIGLLKCFLISYRLQIYSFFIWQLNQMIEAQKRIVTASIWCITILFLCNIYVILSVYITPAGDSWVSNVYNYAYMGCKFLRSDVHTTLAGNSGVSKVHICMCLHIEFPYRERSTPAGDSEASNAIFTWFHIRCNYRRCLRSNHAPVWRGLCFM